MFERWKEQASYDDDDEEVEDRVYEFLNEGARQIALKRLDGDISDLRDMVNDSDEPDPRIPSWMHPACVTYALYMWFNDGNLAKQQRAQGYYALFASMLARMPSLKVEEKKREAGGAWLLRNLYSH